MSGEGWENGCVRQQPYLHNPHPQPSTDPSEPPSHVHPKPSGAFGLPRRSLIKPGDTGRVAHWLGRATPWLKVRPLDGSVVEGNGNAGEGDRGNGSGAAHACAEDAEIGDLAEECVQHWPRRFGRGRGRRTVDLPPR